MEKELFVLNDPKNLYLLSFRRFFAKFIDLCFAQILSTLFFIFSWLFWIYYHNIELFYIYYWLSFWIFLYIYENISFTFFWNTIWKKILWIKILNLNWDKLTFLEKIRRIFLSNLFWVFFFIWPFVIILWIFQFIKFIKTGNTTYDKKYLIKYEKIWIFRKILSFFYIFLVYLFLFFSLTFWFIHYNKENYFINLKENFESKEQFSDNLWTLYKPNVEKRWEKIFVIMNYKFNYFKEEISLEWLKSIKEENFKGYKHMIEKSDNKKLILEVYKKYIDYNVYFETNYFDKNWKFLYKVLETPEDFSKFLDSLNKK